MRIVPAGHGQNIPVKIKPLPVTPDGYLVSPTKQIQKSLNQNDTNPSDSNVVIRRPRYPCTHCGLNDHVDPYCPTRQRRRGRV